MGSGASAPTADPAFVTKEEARALAGEGFDEARFDKAAIVNSDYPDGVVPKEKWQEALHVNTLSTSTVGDVMLSATASSALSISNTPAPTPTAEAAGAVGVTEAKSWKAPRRESIMQAFNAMDTKSKGVLSQIDVIKGCRSNSRVRELLGLPEHIVEGDSRDQFEEVFHAMEGGRDDKKVDLDHFINFTETLGDAVVAVVTAVAAGNEIENGALAIEAVPVQAIEAEAEVVAELP